MNTAESLDARVLRLGGFGIAAFVLGVLLLGFVKVDRAPLAGTGHLSHGGQAAAQPAPAVPATHG